MMVVVVMIIKTVMMVVMVVEIPMVVVMVMIITVKLHQPDLRLLHAGQIVTEKDHLGVFDRLQQVRV